MAEDPKEKWDKRMWPGPPCEVFDVPQKSDEELVQAYGVGAGGLLTREESVAALRALLARLAALRAVANAARKVTRTSPRADGVVDLEAALCALDGGPQST